MAKHYYNSGEFNLYCDVCAKKIKAHESRLRWDGLRVCTDDWEERQPQDFVRARQDKISIPFSRPVENTTNNITYGMFDLVRAIDAIDILLVNVSYSPADYVSATDIFNILRAVEVNELVTVSELFSTTGESTATFLDDVAIVDFGSICWFDYIDPDYFESIYVGTCYPLTPNTFEDNPLSTETGFVNTAIYVDVSYFTSDYVGTITYFNT